MDSRSDEEVTEMEGELSVWADWKEWKMIGLAKQMYCNRELDMSGIEAVGFDLDYTLAQYKPEKFEQLLFDETVKMLVNTLGYPTELLELKFDWKYMVRGLVLDKKRGNVLKMDRDMDVKMAYHGLKELSKKVQISTYGNTLVRASFDEPDYALIDTRFSLVEAYLFAQLVDFIDKYPEKVPPAVDYGRMYQDVRAAVDLCHSDGTLEKMVANNPGCYINEDHLILPMLKMLQDSGCKTFLVTNRLWEYTNAVMNYICGTNFEWLENFDVVITGSCKPSFFNEKTCANLFIVDRRSGMLLNTYKKRPTSQVGSPKSPQTHRKKPDKVFQGGNSAHVHRMLSIASGSQVLYVGHNISGDISCSKKVPGWRTMLGVPELAEEVELIWRFRHTHKEFQEQMLALDVLEDKIHHLQWPIRFDSPDVEETDTLNELLKQQRLTRDQHQEWQRKRRQEFHKVWGQLMRTGFQKSWFAHQVESFACLYTSQVTNLGLYSPDKYYKPGEGFVGNEFEMLIMQDLFKRDEKVA